MVILPLRGETCVGMVYGHVLRLHSPHASGGKDSLDLIVGTKSPRRSLPGEM